MIMMNRWSMLTILKTLRKSVMAPFPLYYHNDDHFIEDKMSFGEVKYRARGHAAGQVQRWDLGEVV